MFEKFVAFHNMAKNDFKSGFIFPHNQFFPFQIKFLLSQQNIYSLVTKLINHHIFMF
jgi:hypothetical protein